MGKGDKKTKRGKIIKGSYGVRRPKKKSSPIISKAKPAAKKTKPTKKAEPKEKEVVKKTSIAKTAAKKKPETTTAKAKETAKKAPAKKAAVKEEAKKEVKKAEPKAPTGVLTRKPSFLRYSGIEPSDTSLHHQVALVRSEPPLPATIHPGQTPPGGTI